MRAYKPRTTTSTLGEQLAVFSTVKPRDPAPRREREVVDPIAAFHAEDSRGLVAARSRA